MGSITLASATSRRAGIPNSLRTGTVVSVTNAGVLVNIAGGNVLCSMVGAAGAGVAPGATVSVFKQGDSWQVQGLVVGPGQGRGVDINPPAPSTNAVILPPAIKGNAGSWVCVNSTNLVSVSNVSGTVYSGLSISVLWPKGHVLQIVASSFQTFSAATANFSSLVTVRANNDPAGAIYAAYEPFNPNAGNGVNWELSGWLIGDGGVHTLGVCVQTLSTGTVTLVQAANSFYGVLDWGDGSGVTLR